MKIKKLLLGFVTLLFLLVIGLGWGPQFYYYTKLPSAKKIEESATLGEAFSSWNIKALDRKIPKDVNLPPEIIKCSICGEMNPALDSCQERLSLGIIHILINGTNVKPFLWHYKSYQLNQALLYKYDFPVLYKLYLSSYLHMLQTNDIESFCQDTYKKACAKISDEDALDLAARFVVSRRSSIFTKLRNEQMTKCIR